MIKLLFIDIIDIGVFIMKYTTLFFDADNTLLDFRATEQEALKRTFEQYGLAFEGDLRDAYFSINQDLWYQYQHDMISRKEVTDGRFVALFNRFSIPIDGIEVERVYERELSRSHILMKDALRVVSKLSIHFDLYIVSNGIALTQYSRLADSGLQPFFKDVFVSDAIGYRKPMKEYFDCCFARIDSIKREEVLLIGDSLHNDMQGGLVAGIDTCWMNPLHFENKDHVPVTYEIDELVQLYSILGVE